MVLNLSKSERDHLREEAKLAEPYDEEDPILDTLDGKEPLDPYRWRATMARKLLKQDEREKRAAGLPLEPETTPQSERRKRNA